MEVTIKELGEIITGNTPSKKTEEFWNSEDICFVKPDIISENGINEIFESNEYISEEAKKKARVVSKDSIFITCIGSIGKIGIALDGEYAFNQQINAIIPNDKILPKYLAYNLLYNRSRLISIANAPVVPIINKSQFSDFAINIDSNKNKQLEIVNVLDKLTHIIELRNDELSALDDLIKARFVEMFWSCEWTTTLGNYIAELRGGKSLSGTEECKNKVLKTGAATFGWFDPEQYKYLPKDYKPLSEHRVETGDVMISRMNTPELVGACSYVFEAPENMYYPDRLWKVIPKNQANPIFIWQLLWDQEIRRQIKEKSGGTSGTMHNISKQKLLEIKCIDVPVNEQNKFAEFVIQINKSKIAIQKSLDATRVLLDSLMQKYFGASMNFKDERRK